MVARTNTPEYQAQVAIQARKLKADAQPNGLSGKDVFKGYFDRPESDTKDLTRRIIQQMGRDEVLFGEDSVKVGDIMRGFREKGFLDKDSERFLIHCILSQLTLGM
jgi:hypothetical protein